jgi:hypothetical protein
VAFEKSLAATVTEIKEDLKIFLHTRFELLRTELSEKLHDWRGPAILFAVAALLLITSWFSMVFSLIALMRAWIEGTAFGWFWAGLIVTVFFLLAGGSVAAAAYAGMPKTLKPTRTLRVLKEDQQWVQKRTRAV